MFMSETTTIQKPVSDTKQSGCQHDKKLRCPICEDKFCPNCLGKHVGIHMNVKPTSP